MKIIPLLTLRKMSKAQSLKAVQRKKVNLPQETKRLTLAQQTKHRSKSRQCTRKVQQYEEGSRQT